MDVLEAAGLSAGLSAAGLSAGFFSAGFSTFTFTFCTSSRDPGNAFCGLGPLPYGAGFLGPFILSFLLNDGRVGRFKPSEGLFSNFFSVPPTVPDCDALSAAVLAKCAARAPDCCSDSIMNSEKVFISTTTLYFIY